MKGTRNKSAEKRLAKVGVAVEYRDPVKHPHRYHVVHLECGKKWVVEYLKVSREERPEYWRCPNGCHKGVKLPQR